MRTTARNRRPLIVLAAIALLSGATVTPSLAADRGASFDDESAYYPKDPEAECDLNPERCGETDPEPCFHVDGECVTGTNGDYCERHLQECINWYCDRHPEKCGEKPEPHPMCRNVEDTACVEDGDPIAPYERHRDGEKG